MEEKEQETKKTESKQIQLSKNTLYILMGLVSLGLILVIKILGFFGVYSGVLNGIMFVLICGLTVTAMLLSYLESKSLMTEFWLNLAVLAMASIVIF